MRFFLCFIYRGHIPHPPSNHAFSLYLFSYLVFSNHHTLITTLHSVTRKISSPVQSNANQYNRRVVSATFSVHSASRLFFRSCLLVYFFIYFHHIERCFEVTLYICKLCVFPKTKQPEVVCIKMVLFFLPPEDIFDIFIFHRNTDAVTSGSNFSICYLPDTSPQ